MISAVILSHNNETSIENTLTSLAFCDERIIIDDFSTDNTAGIAKKAGAVVYARSLNGDFAAQRNFGLEKAKGEWALFVDSDETVSAGLAKEIQNVVAIDCVGFYVKRQDWLFGRKLLHGETDRVRLLRLARRGAGKWVRPVHEVWQIKGLTGTLDTPLDHFPHPNVAQFIDSVNRYSSINAKYLHGQHVKVLWWHILAYPTAKFFMNYIWHRGFLDGTQGAIIAIMMSMHSFLTRAKLWLLWHPHE
ncbi:hypothetical protein A2363_03470 [Candidatus Gottesmanbacteria bacterium RIFOXYB1_FULL_47_11]|uniref:Glycosyltransferase 2-like domain-containing protein n=1 Tax=Candidatus Gottesmanbacteria bacterium RIFOXYB1_FULL_47_11 TaxID=1798401 RepID=A0A1F6BF41_9BACT|nr:MAG: hypothetical protein A2363_03470 [Candidatus Gottesmanbacteria bacterium RIFOXYB1_FULL_47_11]